MRVRFALFVSSHTHTHTQRYLIRYSLYLVHLLFIATASLYTFFVVVVVVEFLLTCYIYTPTYR